MHVQVICSRSAALYSAATEASLKNGTLMQMRLGWPYCPLDDDSCQSDQWRWSRCGAPEVIHGKVNGSAHKVSF